MRWSVTTAFGDRLANPLTFRTVLPAQASSSPLMPETGQDRGVQKTGEPHFSDIRCATAQRCEGKEPSAPPSRSRRRPTQQRAKATRNQILDAAKLFGERGITGTSTNRIAAAAGVSIGTVYRYFSDRSVMVDELLDRLLIDITTCTATMFNLTDIPILDMYTTILGVITDVLVANAGLVRAPIAGVQFYSSGLPEFEPRLRLMIKVLVIQILGPGDDHQYDVMASVVVNTGFAVVLRASALDVDGRERRELIAATADMIATWFEDHRATDRALLLVR